MLEVTMIKKFQGNLVVKGGWSALVLLSIPTLLWSQEPLEPPQGRVTSEEVEAQPQTVTSDELEPIEQTVTEEDESVQTVTSEEVEAEAQELLDSQGIEESPVPDAYVARAMFTTAVVNREPVDQVVSLDENATEVSFFTDLRNLQGRTVIHRWEFEGEVISEVNIQVKGPRWRAYSIKSLNPGEEGKWTVFVIDESGWPLHASIFQQRTGDLADN
jgi:hypothetical protein